MEVRRRGVITEEECARIYFPFHNRTLQELENGLAAASNQWTLLHKEAVRMTCTIDQCHEKSADEPLDPASHIAAIKVSGLQTIVERAIADEGARAIFWHVLDELVAKMGEQAERDYLCVNYAVHRIVLRRK